MFNGRYVLIACVGLILLLPACQGRGRNESLEEATVDPRLATALAKPALAAVTATSEVVIGEPAPTVFLPQPPPEDAHNTESAATSVTVVPATALSNQETNMDSSTGTTSVPGNEARGSPSPEAPPLVTSPVPSMTFTPTPVNTPALLQTVPAATVTQPSATPTPIPAATTVQQLITPAATATSESNFDLLHFSNCVTRTGNNATIAVPADVEINGPALMPGDEIAVFTPDGSICAGVSVWSGANIAITAWGDDSQTTLIDGLRDGEPMVFRVWLASMARDLPVDRASFSLGDGIYTADSIHAIAGLEIGGD
jgi:hypothetical protein